VETIADFDVRTLDAADPNIARLRGRYFAHFHLEDKLASSGVAWFGVFRRERLALVFALGQKPDGGIEGTDFYAEPNRDGLAAVYAVLAFFRKLIDARVWPYGLVSTYAKNHAMHRRIQRVFGVDGPCSMTFSYAPAETS